MKMAIGGLAGLLLLQGAADPAFAQGATNVVRVTRDPTPTTIAVGEYYTHVFVDVPHFEVPADDNGRRQIGRAILSAFGLGERTRSLSVTLTLSYQGEALPEIPLVTYSFDGNRRLTNYQRVRSYLSPRWQVAGSNPITAKLNYRFSEQATYDPTVISGQVSKVIPSDAIVSTLAKPFVQSLVGLTASIFSAAGARTVNNGDQDDLSPFTGAVGSRRLTFSLATPSGVRLGDIQTSLVVTPTLGRQLIFATEARPANLVKPDTESISALALNLAGTTRNLLGEIEGLKEYVPVTKDRQAATVTTYCKEANKLLSGYGLTLMDRTTLVFQSMIDAGFQTSDNAWLLLCFPDGADRIALTRARGISFVLVTPPPQPAPDPLGLRWPENLKDAMGCWITNKTGDWCQQHAPSTRAILERALADEVKVGVVDLPGVDLSTLPPGRLWSRSQALDALNGKAANFLCYEQGLILEAEQVPYNFGVRMDAGKIVAFEIVKARPEALQCLRR